MSNIKQIVSAKTLYLHIILGFIILLVALFFLAFCSEFIWWELFGEGAHSDEVYHPIAVVVFGLYPYLLLMVMAVFLLLKNYRIQRWPQVKCYGIIVILIMLLFIAQKMFLPDLFA
ncbi:hypothetical protein [Mucilaginibacter gynuensis]|uniref:hypothetical protein n=1 Tax=Mucilaginibacter gynuensis TaxID=1302236 RepID=UPI0031E884B3